MSTMNTAAVATPTVTSNMLETASGQSLKQYSPISTLERQTAAPLGQRLMVAVQANAACCLEGGIESILKLKGKTDTSMSSGNATTLSSTSFEESAQDDFDAFSFLNDNEKRAVGGNAANAAPGIPPKKGFGTFFKKVAQNTTATLERQMQGLAVRMDQGRNPDLLTVGMYDPHTQELLGVTESSPLPDNRQTVRFHIPLVITGTRRQQQVVLKLWIQSGATLLQSTKAAKCYSLGSATMDCRILEVGTAPTLNLSSNLVVGGQFHLCILKDPKFSPLLTRGWSLTDPDMSAYSSNLSYLPLDQSYIFEGKQPEHWLSATEKATESSIVLPIAAAVMELSAKAATKSFNHVKSVARQLRSNRHDFKDSSKATCNMGIVSVTTSSMSPQSALISIGWRRPDSIFELELVAGQQIGILKDNVAAANPAFTLKFHPKVCTDGILPGVLQPTAGKMPSSGFLLGSLTFCITIQNNDQIELWESVVSMESFIRNNTATTVPVPLFKNRQQMGNLLLQLQVTLPEQPGAFQEVTATDGLVSVAGLATMGMDMKPSMDMDSAAVSEAATTTLRSQQLATMGYFFTTQYMEQHLTLRKAGVEAFSERARAYKQALAQPGNCQPFEVKSPKSFRPSSSRTEALLSALPFNVHIAKMDISVIDTLRSDPKAPEYPGAEFFNITHGAPSDHARGFGNVLTGISNMNASGGLRRLEAKRFECAHALQQAQDRLIAGVGRYLGTARQTGQVNHVPARHAEIQGLRWKVFEAVHNLHHITWMCSVRRMNCFSQALGLAVSSYLTSISDAARVSAGWPDVWKRHGYLASFEGLLSAAGKELGMIEDASVAISMLRNVRIVLMADTGIPSKAVYVPSSPYLKWVNIFASGEGATRHYLLQIGIDPHYYQERIPAPLQNGAAVQLYPILFQVGVDIRQWGAHAGKNLTKQKEDSGNLMDDDDDDDGIVDDDVLVQLNHEAMIKLNAYAHAINPQNILLDKVQQAMIQCYNNSQTPSAEGVQLPIHQTLGLLQSHIVSSAGKMNHAILDEAAMIAQQLGGGGLVFCKSGKDRTAMHLTYKQAQFVAGYRDKKDTEGILRDASLIRTHGTRLPICEKNVGQSLYAFNALQVKFMPEALKPPMSTLAGFLKGGEIFKGGGIES